MERQRLSTKEVEAFLASSTPEVRELALELRSLILDVFPDAIEQPDEPARLIGYGFDRTYKGLVCGIALHTEHVNLMLARGTELPDPSKLLSGTGKRARHVKLRQPQQVGSADLRDLLEAAVATHPR
jgi:hypothetical protein